jgi:putative nucleotidyltransferase with HDIG domain
MNDMNRIRILWDKIDETLKRSGEIPPVYYHILQVSQLCTLIALKRGINAELATMAGALHDIASLRNHDIEPYKVKGLTSQNHAQLGSEIANEILEELNITTPDENLIICTAIHKHSDKNIIDSEFDEIIKDADVFAHGLNFDFRGTRWDKLCDEFGIQNPRINTNNTN